MCIRDRVCAVYGLALLARPYDLFKGINHQRYTEAYQQRRSPVSYTHLTDLDSC